MKIKLYPFKTAEGVELEGLVKVELDTRHGKFYLSEGVYGIHLRANIGKLVIFPEASNAIRIEEENP